MHTIVYATTPGCAASNRQHAEMGRAQYRSRQLPTADDDCPRLLASPGDHPGRFMTLA